MNVTSTGAAQIVTEHKCAEDLTLMGEALRLRVLWRCPTLPQPGGCSTIGAAGLSFQVRNGGWAFPRCYDHHKSWCSTLSPPVLFGGVWVDRGLYSGCGSVFTVVLVHPALLVGCCLVLAH